jgi:hypothetical protein
LPERTGIGQGLENVSAIRPFSAQREKRLRVLPKRSGKSCHGAPAQFPDHGLDESRLPRSLLRPTVLESRFT